MGDGGGTSKYPPVQVPGLPAIKSVSAGGWHALALDRQGGVWTWGDRNAPTGAAAIRPHRVAGVANAVVISASEFDRFATGAAVLADGTLWMWGDATSGQLGGSVASRETPAFQVEGVTGARSVSMGYNHALVLLNDGTVIARGSPTSEVWGYWGELGDGTLTPHIEFAPVPGLSGVVQLATGAHTSSVLMQDGTIRAWGQNTFGTVGDGTKTDALSPVVVRLSK
jgi:alpha-tubulin suppressor-like RCC1 family protein